MIDLRFISQIDGVNIYRLFIVERRDATRVADQMLEICDTREIKFHPENGASIYFVSEEDCLTVKRRIENLNLF